MLNLLSLYWIDIVIVLVFILAMAVLYKKGKKQLVLRIVLAAVTEAERAFKESGMGTLKFSQAVSYVYSHLPITIRFLFTQAEIENFIEDAVADLRELLKEKEANILK